MRRRNFLKTLGGCFPLLQPDWGWSHASPKLLELTRDGHSTYSIGISRNASPSEKRGSEELQHFLEEISGARLPIVTDAQKAHGHLVLVGKSDFLKPLRLNIPFPSLGTEGFVLKTAGRHLVIAGGRQRGTMYGVYTFLDKLGCRWFTPEVSRIPKLPTIRVEPLDEIHKPAFEYREPFFSEAMERDWAARNKMNGNHLPLDESTGGKVQYFPFVHSFYALLPPSQYFKDHPEYFSLVDGRRRGENAQLCLTNPDVLRLVTEKVFEWIHQHPEATIVSVSQNDSWGWCECENCLRVEQEEGGAHSGPVLRFVNAVAAEVAKKYPDKLIVIQMLDKRTGHDVLLPPDPEAPTYPDVAGLVFSVYEDYVSTKPFEVKWDVAPGGTCPGIAGSPAGAKRLSLTGTYAQGLTLNRTIQIPGDGPLVHTETVVQNVGDSAIDLVLQSRFDANPTKGLASEEMDAVRVAFSGQDGKAVEKKLIDPEQEPVGSETYTGKSRPDSEWRLINVATGLTLVNRFTNAQVERCFLRWGAKNQNVVGLVLWSPKRRLQPGESMRLDADYEIGR